MRYGISTLVYRTAMETVSLPGISRKTFKLAKGRSLLGSPFLDPFCLPFSLPVKEGQR